MRWVLLLALTTVLSAGAYLLSPRLITPHADPPSTTFDFDPLITYAQKIPKVPDMQPVVYEKGSIAPTMMAQISVGRNDPFKAIQRSDADPITLIFADVQQVQKAVERYRMLTGVFPTGDGKPGQILLSELQPHYLGSLSQQSDGLYFAVSAEGTVTIVDNAQGRAVNTTLTFWTLDQVKVLGISTNDQGQQQAVLAVDEEIFVVTQDTILRNLRVVEISVADNTVTLLDEKNLVRTTLTPAS